MKRERKNREKEVKDLGFLIVRDVIRERWGGKGKKELVNIFGEKSRGLGCDVG